MILDRLFNWLRLKLGITELLQINKQILEQLGGTPAAQARAHQALGVLPMTAICSKCSSHVARFRRDITGDYVCANCEVKNV